MPLPKKIFRKRLLRERYKKYLELKGKVPAAKIREELRKLEKNFLSRTIISHKRLFVLELFRKRGEPLGKWKERRRKAWLKFQREQAGYKDFVKGVRELIERNPRAIAEKYAAFFKELKGIERKTLSELEELGVFYDPKTKRFNMRAFPLKPEYVEESKFREAFDYFLDSLERANKAYNKADKAIARQIEIADKSWLFREIVESELKRLPKERAEAVRNALIEMNGVVESQRFVFLESVLETIRDQVIGILGLH